MVILALIAHLHNITIVDRHLNSVDGKLVRYKIIEQRAIVIT